MKKVLLLNKQIGQTPLEAIQEFRNHNILYQTEKLGYAGRLDPMAEGLLLVLVGEENKHKKKYQDLDKEYECEVLFGVETDTYDVLGLVSSRVIPDFDLESQKDEVLKKVQSDIGEIEQPYPPYSSKTVNGKPLHWWARQNRLSEIHIPTKRIIIYSIKVISTSKIHRSKLETKIFDRLKLIRGDFRQQEIIEGWTKFFVNNKKTNFLIVKLRISCSSGTYIRSLAHRLGQKIGIGAIALSINRTKVGDYDLPKI